MTDTPSIPVADATPDVPWRERVDRALFSVGYLLGATRDDVDMEEFTKCHDVLLAFIKDTQAMYDEMQDDDKLRNKLSDLLTRTANVLKGPPGPLSLHSWHDLPESAALAMDPDKKAIRHAAASFSLWWAMIEADAELSQQPLKDDQVALSFMGSGASHVVNVKDIRAMVDAINGPALPAEEPPCAS